MKQYQFHIEPLPAESLDATVERFNDLGAQGWRAVGKYSLNHMLFEREFINGVRQIPPGPRRHTDQ